MSDIILVLGIATFLHYFGIFTFHSVHYWSLLFLLFSVDWFFESWNKRLEEPKDKEKEKGVNK